MDTVFSARVIEWRGPAPFSGDEVTVELTVRV
ncbi:hypothetical protein GA0115246_109684 [Streptomyces sp. SolWspMP-sol7th]|nr:hypothetical protein GA0115246_109684 [Streptomyces sp. SolWspMP-sol7th]